MTIPGLKIFRIIVGYKQLDIAKRMGVSVQLISAWEHGRRKPSIDQMLEVAGILKIDAAAIWPDKFSTIKK